MNLFLLCLEIKKKFSCQRNIPNRSWGLGLDRFYEGDKKGGLLSIIGWSIIFFSFLFLKCSGYEYVDGVKNYSEYSPNPLIVLPVLTGAYGGFLIIKKAFRLAKQFENAE